MKARAKIFAGILLFLFIGRLSDASLFSHTHFVDGRVIAHSHPYSGTPSSPHHEHSQAQLLSIALISLSMLCAASIRLPAAPSGASAGLFVNLRESYIERPAARSNTLRGPPSGTLFP